MRVMERRLRSLEKHLAPLQRDRSKDMRVILSVLSQQATLANSVCTRTLHHGVLSETVNLDGVQGTISDDELEAFIQSSPIIDTSTRTGQVFEVPKLAAVPWREQ
jgi:hypothetical protein